jgi:hypothetical protein
MKTSGILKTGLVLMSIIFFSACRKETMTPLQSEEEGELTTLSAKPSGGGGSGGTAKKNNLYSGQATAIRANVLGIQTVLSETQPLPQTGGAEENNLLVASVPNLLTARVLHAATIGQGDRSRSEASVADLNLTVAGNTISAGFLMARASALCGPVLAGSSELVGLNINGQVIQVSGSPNQTIQLPLGGKVVINEQSSSTNGGYGAITVTALHVIIDGVADVIISRAHADIKCPSGPPLCNGGDFITGGGWITGTPSTAKGNFGIAGGIKNGAYWGHLTYIDHANQSPKVKATAITNYIVVNNTTRRIEGNCEIDGQSGYTFIAIVSDNGEPGTNDAFSLALSNGYTASGTLNGGNIQLHKPCF